MRSFRWWTLSILVLFSSVAFGRIVVQSGIDREDVVVGEDFTWTISVLASEDVAITTPQWPELKDFTQVKTWESEGGRSSHLVATPQGMTFETFTQKDYNITLKPQKKGPYTLPSLTLTINNQPFESKPVPFEVTDGGGIAAQLNQMRRGQDKDEAEEIFDQLLKRQQQRMQEPSFRSTPKNLNEAFFVQVEVDKTDVYEGEQVNANWYIYTRGALEQIDRLKFPDLKGMWKEDVEPAPALTFSQEIINGVPFKKAMLASYALFPIKSGVVSIDEYKIKAVVRLPSTSFGLFGFGKPYVYTKSSERVKVNVKPLPLEGRPAKFTNAVGTFQVEAVIDGQNLKAYQPLTYKLRIEGQGNTKMIDLPSIDWPATVEVYDTKQTSNFFKNGRSFKQFEIVLVPKQAGTLTLPGVPFSYFDPNLKKYVEKTTQPMTLNIEPGDPNAAPKSQTFQGPATKPEKAPQGPQLPPLILESEGSGFRVPQIPMEAWIGLYLGVFLILGFKGFAELRDKRVKKDMRGLVKKRFKRVYQALGKKEYRKVGTESMNAVYLTLGELSGLGGASLELQKLLAHSPPSVRRDLGEPVRKSLTYFEVLAFAPEAMLANLHDPKEVKKNVQAVENLLLRAIDLSEKEKALA